MKELDYKKTYPVQFVKKQYRPYFLATKKCIVCGDIFVDRKYSVAQCTKTKCKETKEAYSRKRSYYLHKIKYSKTYLEKLREKKANSVKPSDFSEIDRRVARIIKKRILAKE